jgi:hypothetical protein
MKLPLTKLGLGAVFGVGGYVGYIYTNEVGQGASGFTSLTSQFSTVYPYAAAAAGAGAMALAGDLSPYVVGGAALAIGIAVGYYQISKALNTQV